MRTISNDLPLIIPLFDPSRSDQSIWTWWNREGSCWFDQVCPDVMRFIVRVRPSQVDTDAALWSRRTSNSTSRPRCLLSCVAAKVPPPVLDMSNGLGGREGASCASKSFGRSIEDSKVLRPSYVIFGLPFSLCSIDHVLNVNSLCISSASWSLRICSVSAFNSEVKEGMGSSRANGPVLRRYLSAYVFYKQDLEDECLACIGSNSISTLYASKTMCMAFRRQS